MVPHSWCWDCYRAYFRAGHHKRKGANNRRSIKWQADNRDKARIAARKWKSANRKRVVAYVKANYAEKASAVKEKVAAWRKANPEKVRTSNRNRRALRTAAGGQHTPEDIARLLVIQKRKCAYCRTLLDAKFHADHILPISKGGSNDRRNLQLTCVKCNLTKGNRHPIEHARLIGLLL